MFGYKLNLGKLSSTERDETVYAPLRDGASSPSEKGSERDHEEISYTRPVKERSQRILPFFIVLLLLVTNIMTIASFVATKYLTVQLDAAEPEYTPKSAGKHFQEFIRQILNSSSSSCPNYAYQMEAVQLVDGVLGQELHRD